MLRYLAAKQEALRLGRYLSVEAESSSALELMRLARPDSCVYYDTFPEPVMIS